MQAAALTLPQRRLRAAGENLSAHAALRLLTTARPVAFEAVDSRRKRVVTKGTKRARKPLEALRTQRKPPPKSLAQASGTAEGTNVMTIQE